MHDPLDDQTKRIHWAIAVVAALVVLVALNVWFAMPAKAQRYSVVATCGTFTGAVPAVGSAGVITMDQNGVLCTTSTGGGGGGAVTVANGADVAQGTTTDAACASDNGTCTELALLKRANQRLTTLITNLGTANNNGQATMANSSPVTIASDQSAVPVTMGAAVTGGCTPAKTLSAASTNSTNIKASAGTLCKMIAINTTATLYYLKTYDKATAPTCNSDAVLATYPIPPSNGGVAVPLGPFGEAYTLGIGFCLTAGIADNDNANAATGVAISYSFK